MNAVQIENQRPGNADWTLTNPALSREIEGYASKTSYNRGEDVVFHISVKDGASIGTDCSDGQCPSYQVDVFRMGWYSGTGARRVLGPVTLNGYAQPQPILDATNLAYVEFGLIECQWAESFRFSTTFNSDADWVSGIYLARLSTTGSTSKQSYIIFTIRDDERVSDFLFQQSVTTYQAYNNWPGASSGGKSIYDNNSFSETITHGDKDDPDGYGKRASKLSFDRPYGIRNNPSFRKDGSTYGENDSGLTAAKFGVGAGEFLTTLNHHRYCSGRGHEYNFVRFLEKEGYDVSYATNIDVSRDSQLLTKHKAFLSVGHDEYWSKEMRDHVEQARDSGISLGFFSANTCFIQVRFENGSSGPLRTLVCYKSGSDPCASSNIGPCPAATTVNFRNPPVSRPEHTLLGVAFRPEAVGAGTPAGSATDYYSADLILEDVGTWVTADVNVNSGDHLRYLIGYEVDTIPDNVSDRRPGLKIIGASPTVVVNGRADTVTFDATSGATIFSTGSIQWSLGLDDFNCDPVVYKDAANVDIDTNLSDPRCQLITRNVLERFRSRDRTDVFARGTDSAMYWSRREGGNWLPWQSLGGGFISAPAVSSTSANRLLLFAIGLDSLPYVSRWNGQSWQPWNAIAPPPGVTINSNPAAVSRNRVSTDLFVRATAGSDSPLWHCSHDGTSWGAWISLGGGFMSGPAAASWQEDQMLVFAIGLDGALWNKQWINGAWSDWASLGSPGVALNSTPAAVSRSPGKVDVFARGADGAIWQRSHDSVWNPWVSLGGGFNSGPAVAAWHSSKLVLCATGMDNRPWFSEWNGTAWSPWAGRDGSLTSAPAMISWYGSNR